MVAEARPPNAAARRRNFRSALLAVRCNRPETKELVRSLPVRRFAVARSRNPRGEGAPMQSPTPVRVLARRRLSFAKRLVVMCVCFIVMSAPSIAAQEDASQLVQQAVAQMEECREYFRQTGDLSGRAPLLQQALADLDRACPALASAGDRAGAATCFVKAGDAERMLSQRFIGVRVADADHSSVETMMGAALRRYREGERLARAAGASQALADALIGTVRTQLGTSALHDYRSAAAAI